MNKVIIPINKNLSPQEFDDFIQNLLDAGYMYSYYMYGPQNVPEELTIWLSKKEEPK